MSRPAIDAHLPDLNCFNHVHSFPPSPLKAFRPAPLSLRYTYAQETYLLDYTQRCGAIARTFSIGKSERGTDLWVLELGLSKGKEPVAKPYFKYLVCAPPPFESLNSCVLGFAEFMESPEHR